MFRQAAHLPLDWSESGLAALMRRQRRLHLKRPWRQETALAGRQALEMMSWRRRLLLQKASAAVSGQHLASMHELMRKLHCQDFLTVPAT